MDYNDSNSTLTPNVLAFMALCNEYCEALERASSMQPSEFVAAMVRLLPRIYISATSLGEIPDEGYISDALDEETYNAVRISIEQLLGANDSYLEVFEENMKYSDTPIGASIAEGLTDIFQSAYNFVETVRDAPDHIITEALGTMKADFDNYWSQILCNVMRPLNQLRFNIDDDDDNQE